MKEKQYAVLDFAYRYGGMEEHVYPVLLFGERDTVLVDCGYPGSSGLLERELARHGIRPEAITKLLLTHQDDDHIGAAAEIKEKYPGIQILASREEGPYISGERKSLRLQQAEELQKELPEEQKAFGIQFCNRLRAVKPVPLDGVVLPGDLFDWGGGCEIVGTPGHTPGHISIRAFHNDFMITGDAAVVEGRRLALANPGYCLDLDRAQRSLERLIQYHCRRYICYHGGILEG